MMQDKAKITDFMGAGGAARRIVQLPTLMVSKLPQGATKVMTARKVAYDVDSLQRLVKEFDRQEREIVSK